uniref:Peroxin-7 n=1 Tax=Arcella intermedia TaxID=1963864 RepID=A0A6B2LA89_9EUKA
MTPKGLQPIAQFYTQDGLFDCAWSEENPNHLISVSGDGSMKLWDVESRQGRPLRAWKEHTQEIYSVDWNMQKKDCFITGSWDRTIKLWSPSQQQSLRTFAGHAGCIYSAVWDPRSAGRFASASGDWTVRIWDLRDQRATLNIRAHPTEVLTVDWNKYQDHILFSGSVDKSIKMWDLRQPANPLTELHGHKYAVRRLRCSPHNGNVVASVSYDRRYHLWDVSKGEAPLVVGSEHHSEFVVGCDFSLFVEGLVATCGWDCAIAVWKLGSDPRAAVVDWF